MPSPEVQGLSIDRQRLDHYSCMFPGMMEGVSFSQNVDHTKRGEELRYSVLEMSALKSPPRII